MRSSETKNGAKSQANRQGLPQNAKWFLNSGLPVLVAGLSIGWLVGLSETPIVREVIVVLLTATVTVAALLMGVNARFALGKDADPVATTTIRRRRGSYWPIALLPVGIVIGSTLGFSARRNEWFITREFSNSAAVRSTRDLPAASTKEFVVQPPPGLKSHVNLNSDLENLTTFRGLSGDEIIRRLARSPDSSSQYQYARLSSDSRALASLVEVVSCLDK